MDKVFYSKKHHIYEMSKFINSGDNKKRIVYDGIGLKGLINSLLSKYTVNLKNDEKEDFKTGLKELKKTDYFSNTTNENELHTR